jgi:WD40 repeat protein
VQLWDVATRTIRKTFTGHAGPIHGMAMSSDATTLYTGSFDTNVIAWDLTGRRGAVSTFTGGDLDPQIGAWTLSIAPDNRTIAEGAANGEVVLTDLFTHRQRLHFHVADGVVSGVSFSPDGRSLLVSANQPPGGHYTAKSPTWLEIWSLSPKPHVIRRFDTSDWPFLSWSTWSPDGRTVAATGFLDDQTSQQNGAVAEWSAITGRPLGPPLRTKGGYTTDVAFAPHGTDVAVSGAFSIDSILADPATGKRLATLKGSNSSGEYSFGSAYSPDGTKVATAQWDGTIRIWDARTGRQLEKIQDAGQDVVEGVVWSPDGKTLAVTDWDPSLRLYDVATRQEIGPAYSLPSLPDPLQYDPWVQFTPNGKYVVVSGTNDETVAMPVSLAAWSDEACRIAGRGFTRAE